VTTSSGTTVIPRATPAGEDLWVIYDTNSSTSESNTPIGASRPTHGSDPFDGPSTSRKAAPARHFSPMRLRRHRIPVRRFHQDQVSAQTSLAMVDGLPGWNFQTPGSFQRAAGSSNAVAESAPSTRPSPVEGNWRRNISRPGYRV